MRLHIQQRVIHQKNFEAHMKDILHKIIHAKTIEVTARKKLTSLVKLQETIANQNIISRDFIGAIKNKIKANQPAIIAEIKKASPSRGIIRNDFDPKMFAQSYENAGAACLSVLTDEEFFQGSVSDLQYAREACSLPVLRKDFMIDAYQIYESRAIGADCILLIAAALSESEMQEFCQIATSLNMATLVEVHNEEELNHALKLPTPLIGINNRNLHNFVTDLNVTLSLLEKIPADRIVISESGINTKEDVILLRRNGVSAFLIGETFMRAHDPGDKLKEIIS